MLQKANQLTPTDSETVRLLGVAYGMTGNHEKAIEYFTKVVELNPDNAGAFLNLSNAYKYIGDETNARIFMEKALSIDPNVGK